MGTLMPFNGHSHAIWNHTVNHTSHLAEVSFLPLPYPAKAATWFSDPEGMQGWVDLVGWLHTKVVYLPNTFTHPSMVLTRLT